jgi:hypothetical protein
MEPRSKAPASESRETSSRASARPQKSHAPSSRPQPKHGWSRDRFCEYLRAQRERVSLSIEDIARVTKIPERSLRQLEEGKFEELPADVFVRGFLRSYARVVGVNADEVVRRYAMCGLDPAPVASEFAQVAAEQIAALAEKDPSAGEVAVAKVEAPVADEPSGGKLAMPPVPPMIDEVRTASAPVRNHGSKKRRKSGRHRARHAGGAPATAPTAAEPTAPTAAEPPPPAAEAREAAEPVARAQVAARPRTPVKRERAFLPPAWSEEETGRRGPLTLAVIILVIVATLTMSYLLRRPSYSGDGVTSRDPIGQSARAA